jgi:hypothetical protein
MKPLALITIIVVAAVLGSAAVNSAFPSAPPGIVGTWAGVDDGGLCGIFQFESDGNISVLVIQSQIVVPDPGKRLSLRYEINQTMEPWQLDLIKVESGRSAPDHLKAIVKAPAADTLVVKTAFSEERPTSFLDAEDPDALVLKRIDHLPISSAPSKAPPNLALDTSTICKRLEKSK